MKHKDKETIATKKLVIHIKDKNTMIVSTIETSELVENWLKTLKNKAHIKISYFMAVVL